MLKTIQYLNANPKILELLVANKVCLVEVQEHEVKSIIEVYSTDAVTPEVFWD